MIANIEPEPKAHAVHFEECDLQKHSIGIPDDENALSRCAELIASDYHATRENYLLQAATDHLGRIPSEEEITENLECEVDLVNPFLWWKWAGEIIALSKVPRSAIYDGIYHLRWYWKNLAKA